MPVAVRSFVASGSQMPGLITELDQQLRTDGIRPDLIIAFYSVDHDDTALHAYLTQAFPGVPLIGGTSGRGILSPHGLSDESTVGLLMIADPDGRYGAASGELGDDPADAAERLLHEALDAADAIGELPELVWIYQAVGDEDAVLEGLRRVVGDRCPIVGGSAADDDESGRWRELGPGGVHRHGMTVAVLFPTGTVSVAFQGGYEPTGQTGIADVEFAASMGGPTEAAAGPSYRVVRTIDGKPAAEVYREWMLAALPAETLVDGVEALMGGTAFALGVPAGESLGVTSYRLVQPLELAADGTLTLAAGIDPGDRVFGMRGFKDGLVLRAGRVVSSAIAGVGGPGGDLSDGVAGGIVFYCTDCRTAVGDDIDRTASAVAGLFRAAPFLGAFTGGEQGPALGRNVHANLMITAVVFGR